jgi:hypothetical protein
VWYTAALRIHTERSLTSRSRRTFAKTGPNVRLTTRGARLRHSAGTIYTRKVPVVSADEQTGCRASKCKKWHRVLTSASVSLAAYTAFGGDECRTADRSWETHDKHTSTQASGPHARPGRCDSDAVGRMSCVVRTSRALAATRLHGGQDLQARSMYSNHLQLREC